MTSSSIHFQVRAAMRAGLVAVAAEVGDPTISWEGRAYAPPNPPARWLKEAQYRPTSETLVASRTIQMLGYVQYDVNEPTGPEAIRLAEEVADAIKTYFYPTRTLSALVQVIRAERGPMTPMPDFLTIPVTVYWRVLRGNP